MQKRLKGAVKALHDAATVKINAREERAKASLAFDAARDRYNAAAGAYSTAVEAYLMASGALDLIVSEACATLPMDEPEAFIDSGCDSSGADEE